MRRASLFFGLGLLTALAAGWIAFPRALYERRPQPFAFRHRTHAAKSGTAACNECHTLRDDGSFAGIPKVASCAGCHAEPMGSSRAEAELVAQYVKPGRETPWLVYSQQPANVRFSHAIHTRRAGLACKQCHGLQGESDEVRVYERNRISGYSRDIWGRSLSRWRRGPHDGMKMSDCVVCHRARGVEAGCLGCHQ
jgi:menaquinone reductase, multiheme cytochrome c subunit